MLRSPAPPPATASLPPAAPATAARRRAVQRGARRELEAARALGSARTRYRPRHVSAPDVRPVVTPAGVTLSVEVKHRKRLPRLLVAALDQARRYLPSATAVAVVSEAGGRALAVLDLAAFAQLVGLRPLELPAQPPLPLGSTRGAK